MENEHKILRYKAVLETTKKEDAGRQFIISYRLSDDTIGVYEPPVRNSGIIGGKFLENSRISKTGTTKQRQRGMQIKI